MYLEYLAKSAVVEWTLEFFPFLKKSKILTSVLVNYGLRDFPICIFKDRRPAKKNLDLVKKMPSECLVSSNKQEFPNPHSALMIRIKSKKKLMFPFGLSIVEYFFEFFGIVVLEIRFLKTSCSFVTGLETVQHKERNVRKVWLLNSVILSVLCL